MNDSLRPDQLVIKTHHEGDEPGVTLGDRRMVELDPDGVTITRGLSDQFPSPSDPAAAQILDEIYVAHAESDGPTLLDLCDRFLSEFGWHPRTEWYRVLGLEILNDPRLLEYQQALIADYHACLRGAMPANAVQMDRPLDADVLEWALGANYLNLMEWLWKRGEDEAVLENFPHSLLGLREKDDNGRHIERLLYRASSESRLGRKEQAHATIVEAKAIDETEFDEVWKLYAAKMPELSDWV